LTTKSSSSIIKVQIRKGSGIMKLIEKTLMGRKMRYDTESTDYSVAKEMANKIMINN
jgi:hypothetical protein